MNILIKDTNTEDLHLALLMFSGHEIVEIFEHGDLIDRDELMKHVVYMPQEGGNLPVVYRSYVKAATAVIPAEMSEE